MNRTCFILSVVLACSMATPSALAQKSSARGGGSAFEGWADAVTLEARDATVRAVLVPGIGGRVMFYGLGGENVLWVNPAAAGKTLATAGAGFEPGGFQVDLGPEVSGLPAHPDLWAGPYALSNRKKQGWLLRAPEDKAIEVELEKEVLLDPASGDLGFLHRLKNKGDRDSAFSLWHRLAAQPGGFVLLPLNKKSRFATGWSEQKSAGGKLTYEAGRAEHPAVRVMEGVLVARTGGEATKVGADSEAQWVAYAVGRTLLMAHFPVYSTATYSEGGNSVTVAWDEKRTELQPYSPEARLRSRKSYEFPLKLSLLRLPAAVTTHEEARALVDKVPGSPFQ